MGGSWGVTLALAYAQSHPKLVAALIDALPSHGGETQVRVSQSQVAELGLGSTLPASNSRKG
jgi:pimeloyl-ACP methyl ester carboxylesterase